MMIATFYYWRTTSIGFGQFSSTGLGRHIVELDTN